MKVIYNTIIPFPGFLAVNLFGVLFVRKSLSHKLTPEVINHEAIHTAQMRETLYVGFYVWYLVEWLVRLIVELCSGEARTVSELNRRAYSNISFEQEAYAFERAPDYTEYRTRFSWIGMI